MKISCIILITISVVLSACDRKASIAASDGESDGSTQSNSGKATERSSDSRPPRDIDENQDHRSKEMKAFLNSPPPQWLKLGSSIRPEAVDTPPELEKVKSRSVAPNGRFREIVIDGVNLKLPILASVMTWVAVSPDSKRVVLERGEICEVRDVEPDGVVSDSGIPLPELNFESDRRWMLTRWSWISDTELVTSLNRPTADGDSIAESKLYYYNLGTRNLREVDLPGKLKDQNDPYLEVLGNADRLVHIRTLRGAGWLHIPESP
jgi:hypothetical protein